ncbi:hypothetical protein ACIPSE_36995 [Streptomyces sp. NPDC090106]
MRIRAIGAASIGVLTLSALAVATAHAGEGQGFTASEPACGAVK